MTLSVSNLGIDGLEDVEQIGTGGSSRVYRARQADLDRIVAVKVLNLGHDQSVSKRFDRERKAMGRLSLHEGIVPVYSSGMTTHGEPYLVMPYYANGSLQDQIDAGPMEWQTAVSYVDVAAETIAAAHDEGVVHLDLKPANILLTNHGAPRIADFGIAKLTTGQGASAGTTGGAAFTPAYSAPETFLDGVTGPPSDVYGLGATLWALLVGHPPFLTPGEDTNLMAVIGRVVNNPVGDLRQFTPASICDVIERAMAKEPEDRYQTARQFSLALKHAAAEASPDFQPVSDSPNRGTILFPEPAPPAIPRGADGPISADTASLSRVDAVELPPSIASTAAMPAADPPRPLLQETAQPLPRPVGGPPSIAPTPLFDLDRFRFGPVVLGIVAFLGVIAVAFWAINRGADTRATDGGPTVTVTDPAGPSLDPNSGDEQPATGNTATGGLGGSTAPRTSATTAASTRPTTTPSSVTTSTSTSAPTSTTAIDHPVHHHDDGVVLDDVHHRFFQQHDAHHRLDHHDAHHRLFQQHDAHHRLDHHDVHHRLVQQHDAHHRLDHHDVDGRGAVGHRCCCHQTVGRHHLDHRHRQLGERLVHRQSVRVPVSGLRHRTDRFAGRGLRCRHRSVPQVVQRSGRRAERRHPVQHHRDRLQRREPLRPDDHHEVHLLRTPSDAEAERRVACTPEPDHRTAGNLVHIPPRIT